MDRYRKKRKYLRKRHLKQFWMEERRNRRRWRWKQCLRIAIFAGMLSLLFGFAWEKRDSVRFFYKECAYQLEYGVQAEEVSDTASELEDIYGIRFNTDSWELEFYHEERKIRK